MNPIQLSSALQVIKLDKDATYLIVYDPKDIDPVIFHEMMGLEEFKDTKIVAIASYDINSIRVFNLKEQV
ncbi:MAG TPA: hypothetical protein VE971_05030 [Candidatus Eisenbacteria bacterium]|nr:hypothetical protein [Candidatus Eisenbacteria bacterium]